MISFISKPVILGLASTSITLGVAAGVQTWRLNNAQDDLVVEKALHKADIATWRAAGIQATAEQLKRVRALETSRQKVTDNAEIRGGARISAINNGVRTATGANSGRTNGSPAPALSYSPGVFDWASGRAVISTDDARICAVNTVKAQEWLGWYRDQIEVTQ